VWYNVSKAKVEMQIIDMKNLLVISAVFALLVMPVMSFAATGYEEPPPSVPGFSSASAFLGVLDRVIGWIFTLLLVLAVIFILYAAFKYLTAAGDPTTISTANKMLLYAAIAIAVAVLSRSIPLLVKQFVQSGAAG
jgi:hypothetical protein